MWKPHELRELMAGCKLERAKMKDDREGPNVASPRTLTYDRPNYFESEVILAVTLSAANRVVTVPTLGCFRDR